MKNRFSVLLVFVFFFASFFALVATDAYSETAILYPMMDNTIFEGVHGSTGEDFEDNSCGGGTGMTVGLTDDTPIPPNARRRALVMFDVAGTIPPAATITSVSLTMTVQKVQRAIANNAQLHKLSQPWGEGTTNCDGDFGQGIDAADGDATWLARSYLVSDPQQSIMWTQPGAEGDYETTVSADTFLDPDLPNQTWASTSVLVADVQGWVNGAANYGWIVIGGENLGAPTAFQFGTKESENPPILTVEFTCPPGGCEACCDSAAQMCSFVPPGTCISPDYLTGGTTCDPLICIPEQRACCIPDPDMNFICSDLTPADCAGQGGVSQKSGSDCNDNNICGLEPWRDELPSPPVLEPVSIRTDGAPQYEITMTQFQQNLHRDLPDTTVWGYNDSFPGPTIAATVDKPIEVTYINDLRDDAGNLRTTHFLKVDETPHGPNYWRDSARTVVHLHGGHVPARFDGLPEYDFLPGSLDTYQYPNNQIPATMWYHDHALGITRLNVIMGLAAFYVLNPDCSVTPNDPDCNGSLPSGAYDVPFVIQDRDFETDINDEFTGDFDYPEDLQQVFHGQNIVVNGKVWPYLQVDQGKYRFRVLNGSTTRTYTISFVNITDPARPSLPITVIGTEGGFYDAPRPAPNDELTLGPAERFEFIVDFAGANRRDEIIIKNSAVINFPSGTAPAGGAQNIMKLEVSGRSGFTGPVPSTLRTFTPLDPTGIPSRVFNLVKIGDEWLVQSLDAQGNVIGEHWDDITEYPMLGDTEIWEFKNTFGLMHPMHVHLVLFQVLNRQAIDDNGVPFGPIFPPEPLELNAWKDTVKSLPDTVTRVIMRFDDYLGKFPYHCHIIEHEDHEMMRQFQVTNDPANCDGDGICEPNEDCISCPTDCAQVSGASCGNGLCEIGDGENSSNCAQDCAPGCGIGGVGCSDSACTPAGFFCRQSARVLACCGDALCEGQETPVNCSNDCPVICTQTEPVEVSCFDGDDNDCDDTFDCADTDCDRAVGPQTTCGIGECAATGNRECSGGTEIDTCTPGKPRDEGPFGDMTCSDGLDNDCDGLTDNPVDPDCDPVDCSQYTERRPCNREPTNTCVWDRTNNVCVLK